ncbi:MAG: hypothetical protein WC679_13430 [Bacteroidales bacterium]|jgi:hypothetical protein
MLNDQEVKSEFQENYRYAHDFWGPYVESARVNTLAAAGYTWTNRERKALEMEQREAIEFNIIRRPIQFFSGYLRDNLNSIVISPVEGSDEKTADQLTKISYDVWDKGLGYQTFLDSCDEMFKSGMSLCGIYMDYSKDFLNGDIKFYKRTYNSFYLDPTFENIDLSDCSFAIMRDVLDRKIIKQLIPFIDPQVIDDLPNSQQDDKFLAYHPQFTLFSRKKGLIAYDQYYKKITKNRKFLVDKEGGHFKDITDLDNEQIAKMKNGIYRMRKMRDEASTYGISKQDLPPVLDIVNAQREFVELNIMLNGQNVFTGVDKTEIEDTYPFIINLCYFEPSIWMPSLRVQGMASTMYSIQRQFNKRHMKIIDKMDSTISTGYKYIIGSIADPTELQQAGQNKLIGIDPNAKEGMNSVQELNSGTADPTIIQYGDTLSQLAMVVSNVNESVLGVDEGGNTQLSGRLAETRIAQGLRSNRKVFDNIDETQKILGKLTLKAIQNKYPPEKIKRILGEDPTEQFYNKDFEQYDATVKEGIRSQSQRDAYYYELVNLKREQIVDVPQAEIVNALQMAGISDLKEAIEKETQMKQQSQQQQVQLEQAVLQKQIGLLEATTAEKYESAGEKASRKFSNFGLEAERQARSQRDEATAALDKAKAIVELSKMNDDRILQVLQIVNEMEQAEKENNRIDESKDMMKAEMINRDVTNNSTQQTQQSQEGG